MVILQDEDPAERYGDIESGAVEIVLGINARLDLDKRADVVVVHVVDANGESYALEMVRDRSQGRTEIEPVVLDPEMKIDVAAEEEPMAVAEGIFNRVLVPIA